MFRIICQMAAVQARCVLDNFTSLLLQLTVIDSVQVWELHPEDALGRLHHIMQVFLLAVCAAVISHSSALSSEASFS